jgi:hypothetical protein
MSSSDFQSNYRRPSEDETRLLTAIFDLDGNSQFDDAYVKALRVKEMNDGGMGSLTLLQPDVDANAERKFGSALRGVDFKDSDGMHISASINLDSNGVPFELDLFKGDFSPLIKTPHKFTPEKIIDADEK